MNTIDLSPLYRSSIGFDRLGALLDNALRADARDERYPAYNIEMLDDNQYEIALDVAGFRHEELTIEVEQGVLTVSAKRAQDNAKRRYLHKGITLDSFTRKFNLAEYVEVTGADLADGMLTIRLVKDLPESMKPKYIEIGHSAEVSGKLEDNSKAA